MFRKSLLASAVSLALLPNIAGALGLGGIRTQSALNEPFSGQIDLLDVKPAELDAVKVRLASEDEFSKAGAPRPHFLTRLSFRPQISSTGRAVVRVSSSEPVREPYLDFLIEVNWPQGRLVKEYTVLLDPPVTLDRPLPKVEQPAIRRPSLQRDRRGAAPPREAVTQPPASVDTSAFPMRHGPVAPGAGLWQIARRMAPAAGATVAQTAMALYRNNQGAFIRGDINKLKVDEVLEIPTAAELFALDTGAASREFEAALRGDRVTSTPLTDITATPLPEDRLAIAGAAEPTPPAPVAAEELASQAPAQLPPAQGPTEIEEALDAGEAKPELGAIKQDLLLVQEAGESTRQETAELRGRIRELETQLADIQRLLELSNERFARLQLAESEQLDTPDAGEADEPLSAVEAPDDPVEMASSQTQTIPGSDEAVALVVPQAGLGDTPETAETARPPASAPPFWESIPQSVLAMALAAPLLLLLLGWMIRRRRQSLEDALKPEEFGLAPEGPVVAAASAAAGVSSVEQASQSTDDSPQISPNHSGFADLEEEAEEGDAISEADVYIAYGRYREAESLLEEEIARSPDRLDIKYKLADAYYGARNLQGLEGLVEQLQRSGDDRNNPDQWQRIETMLRDLKGAGGEGPRQADGGDDGSTLKVVDPVAPRESAFLSSVSPGERSETSLSASGFSDTPDASTAVYPSGFSLDQLSQDLQLDADDLELIGGGLATPAGEETLEVSGAASDPVLELEDLESLKDIDLASFSTPVPPMEPASGDVSSAFSDDSQVESLDIGPETKESIGSDLLSTQWQTDSEMWDEVATKIDLARAYLEMEDPEAARVILDEVAEEGNEGQRAEARELMERLS